MSKYFIEEARCDITNSLFGNVVATIKFKEDDKTNWLSLVEVEGIPNCILTDKDMHEKFVREDLFDDEFTEFINDHTISDFNGIFLGEYTDIFCSIADDPENPAVPLIRYLVALARCDTESEKSLIEMAEGKYVDELDIPISDLEEDYLAELEEDEEES